MDALSLVLFAGALVLTAGTPGPSIAALVSRVITRGWRNVLPFLAALWVGEIVWLTAAMLGLSALAQTFQTAFMVLKWLGCAYLCWLAFRMWRQSPKEDAPQEPGTRNGQCGQQAEMRAERQGEGLSMFLTGLALTFGNPKIMVFYIALLPSLIDLSAAGLREWAVLSVVCLVSLAATDLSWTFLAHKARLMLRTPRATRIANRIGALTLGGAAAAIAARH